MTKEEFLRVRPLMVAMNELLRQLIDGVNEDQEKAFELARQFRPILQAHFGDDTIPGFVVPD